MYWCCADDNRDSNEANAYFVLEGRCTCVQRLRVRKTTENGRDNFALIRTHGGHAQPGKNVQTVYVKMCDLRPGSVFGLGETSYWHCCCWFQRFTCELINPLIEGALCRGQEIENKRFTWTFFKKPLTIRCSPH